MFERIITSMPARCMEAIQARTASSGAGQDFGARVKSRSLSSRRTPLSARYSGVTAA